MSEPAAQPTAPHAGATTPPPFPPPRAAATGPGPIPGDSLPPAGQPGNAAAQAGSGAQPERAARQGWMESLQAMWRELPGLVSDRVDLLSLELQRAGRALAQIVAMLVAAAILGVTAWLTLWAGIAVGLVELGLHWSLALLLVLGLNAGAAMLALARLRSQLPLLRLPATRRHLTPGRTTEPAAPKAKEPAAAGPASTPQGQAG